MTTKFPPKTGPDRWGALLIVFGAWFAAFVAFIIVWLTASGTAVGHPCQGEGFGCFPTERRGIEFLGFIIGIPATIAWATLGLIVTALVSRIKNLRWWWRGILSLVICLVVFSAIVAIIIQVR